MSHNKLKKAKAGITNTKVSSIISQEEHDAFMDTIDAILNDRH